MMKKELAVSKSNKSYRCNRFGYSMYSIRMDNISNPNGREVHIEGHYTMEEILIKIKDVLRSL